MIEVSTILFTLLIEGFVILLIILLVWSFLAFKRNSRDKKAAFTLVEHIKDQSETRLQHTGSFLNEKYRFEGDELKNAVEAIDKSEKKFIQNIINVYLKRDADGLISMDASMADLIDTYKSLSPIMPDAETMAALEGGENHTAELEQLRETNARLSEELSITKETMGNMIAEFGNMFGGGAEHELAKHEVLEKVGDTKNNVEDDNSADTAKESPAKEDSSVEITAEDNNPQQQDSATDNANASENVAIETVDADSEPEQEASAAEKQPQGQIVTDEDIDDLLDGIDLSEDDN